MQHIHDCLISMERKAAPARELAAVLQLMARAEAWITREMLSDGARWRLFTAAERGARGLGDVAPGLVEELKRRDFITPEEDDPLRWRLSARGRRWLARHVPGMARLATAERRANGNVGDDEKTGKGTRRKRGETAAPPRKARQRLLIRDEETGALREVEVNLRENPLMWLARRKDATGRPYLEPHHVAAGERLRMEYESARMQPKVTAEWNPAFVASDRARTRAGARTPYSFAERAIAARERVHEALGAIGPELADVVVAVCCLGHGIEAAEKALSWPRRSARLVLRIALERLANHYGMGPARAERPQRWKRVLEWHVDDGRPQRILPERQDAEE